MSEDDSEQQEVLLQIKIGEWLAKGHTNSEILERLVAVEVEPEEAQMLLRRVYDTWSTTRECLSLQTEDDRNWHQYLRMQLLQKALEEQSTPSRRLALSILDSLAAIQGVTATVPTSIPLPILLIPATAEDNVQETEDGESE